MKFFKLLSIVLLGALAITSCKLEKNSIPTDKVIDAEEQLNIPDKFDFSTSKTIILELGDKYKKATRFNIYTYDSSKNEQNEIIEDDNTKSNSEEMMGEKLFTKVIMPNDETDFKVSVPSHINKLYVTRQVDGVSAHEVVDLSMGKTNYQLFTANTQVDDTVDMLYGVNTTRDLFTINTVTGVQTMLNATIPDAGSVACAYDQVNRLLYYITNSSPNKLYSYNIDTEVFVYIGNTNSGGARLEYRKEDGLLYYSSLANIKTIDPSDASLVNNFTIIGLHNPGWGDIAFTDTGVLYLCSLSGLYRLDVGVAANTYDAVRINASDLPFNPTSMAFDSNSNLWLGVNEGGMGRTIIMDKVTGGWEYKFSPHSIKVNDLTCKLYDESTIPETDTDGDGVIDFYDVYPNDPERAFVLWGPSEFGIGTLAFEDLWTSQGDYDFNDLVLNYKTKTVLNAQNDVVEIFFQYDIKNIGASYINGFGFELPILPSNITGVTGQILTENMINVAANGTEIGQSKAVVIVMDNNSLTNNTTPTFELKVSFASNLSVEDVNLDGINPFIFIDGNRDIEVHLIDHTPTDLADMSKFGTKDDISVPANGTYYRNIENMPWALDMKFNLMYPKETHNIMLGYLKFLNWAQSGGALYTDWYKEVVGYRDLSHLEN